MIDQLPLDIIDIIIRYLNGKDISHLLLTCQHIYGMRHSLIYRVVIDEHKVKNLSYYNQFIKLCVKTDNDVVDCSKVFRIYNYQGAIPLINFIELRELNMSDYECNMLPSLPPNLRRLRLPSTFNGGLVDVLPSSLRVLHLGRKYNQPLYQHGRKVLNFGLKCIIFGHDFNQPIISESGSLYLPPSLVEIDFGYEFNQPIFCKKMALGPKLKKLKFGCQFNQSIISQEGLPYIPLSVKDLKLLSLIQIALGINLNGKKYSALPNGLTNLKIMVIDGRSIKDYVPKYLESLHIIRLTNGISGCFPSKLRELRIGFIGLTYEFGHGDLPDTLELLDINKYNKYIPATIIPNNVETLILGHRYEHLLDPDLKVSKIILHNKDLYDYIPYKLMSRVVMEK